MVLHKGIQLGESPVWSEVDNLLYFVDIDGKAVHSYDPSDGRHIKVDTPAKAAAVSLSTNLLYLTTLSVNVVVHTAWRSCSV